MINNLSSPHDWPVFFGVTLSSLCFFRNKLIFKRENTDPAAVSMSIRARGNEILSTPFKKVIHSTSNNHTRFLIKWHGPHEDFIKVNVDGSFMTSSNNVTCGGVLRDSLDRFIKGFSCNFGSCSIMHAEL
ncbi:hypothetical protein AHAS_Ahas05G0036500 [Arachis hypogaea]